MHTGCPFRPYLLSLILEFLSGRKGKEGERYRIISTYLSNIKDTFNYKCFRMEPFQSATTNCICPFVMSVRAGALLYASFCE